VRDSLVLDPASSSFHPATPNAAGMNLVALSAHRKVVIRYGQVGREWLAPSHQNYYIHQLHQRMQFVVRV
jgi:hypothetical protein